MKWVNASFIWVGRKIYWIEKMIQIRFRNAQRSQVMKEIGQELALEKGVEAVHQILLYSLIIGIPLWEMNKSSDEAKAKEQRLEQRIQSLEKITQEAQAHLEDLKKIRWAWTFK